MVTGRGKEGRSKGGEGCLERDGWQGRYGEQQIKEKGVPGGV